MATGTPPVTFRVERTVKGGTTIRVLPNGGYARVRSGHTIIWNCDENFSLLLRRIAFQLDADRAENPTPPGVTGGWTPMARSHSHIVGEGPYFIKYWVMLEDPTVEILDPGIIIDR